MSDVLNFCKQAAFMVATAKSISDKTKTIGQLELTEGGPTLVNHVTTKVIGRGGVAGARTVVVVEFDPTVTLADIEKIVDEQPGVEPDKIYDVTKEQCTSTFTITDTNNTLTHKLTDATGCVDHSSNCLVILSYTSSLKFGDKIYIQIDPTAFNNCTGFASYSSNSNR